MGFVKSYLFYGALKCLKLFKYGNDGWDKPLETQEKFLQKLMKANASTDYGKKYDFFNIKTIDKFFKKVPLTTYEDYVPFFEEIEKRLNNSNWSEPPNVLSSQQPIGWVRTSGTTNVPKMFPINNWYLNNLTLATTQLQLSMKKPKLLSGKLLTVVTINETELKGGLPIDYISSIALSHTIKKPGIGSLLLPSESTLKIANDEKRYTALLKDIEGKKITGLAGVPIFMADLLDFIQEKGKMNLITDNLEAVISSGEDFGPLASTIFEYLGGEYPVTNAYGSSELNGMPGCEQGEKKGHVGFLKNLIYGIIDEDLLLKVHKEGSHVNVLQDNLKHITEAKIGDNYGLACTTVAGLYNYLNGDIIKIVGKDPIRFEIIGRWDGKIGNIDIERLYPAHVKIALEQLIESEKISNISNFGYYPDENNKKYFVIAEASEIPGNLQELSEKLDKNICEGNELYKKSRGFRDNVRLENLEINFVPENTFWNFQKEKKQNTSGSLVGQPKMERLLTLEDYTRLVEIGGRFFK
ncbi:MAG: GH3 auxin-responsive promoter family protein [Nanoarchaeota archaeon]|nr:GH3 auxin-responsive promoter family protein [Nanoarchaeota archaeon]